MMSRSTLEASVYAWIYSVISHAIPVIWVNDNAPRPTVPYVTLNIPTEVRAGVDYVALPNASGVSAITGNRDFPVYIQAIGGKTTADTCNTIGSSLDKPTVQALLRASGIAVVNILPVKYIPELVDTRWEGRHSLDVMLRYAGENTDTVGLIDIANIEGLLMAPDLITITTVNL